MCSCWFRIELCLGHCGKAKLHCHKTGRRSSPVCHCPPFESWEIYGLIPDVPRTFVHHVTQNWINPIKQRVICDRSVLSATHLRHWAKLCRWLGGFLRLSSFFSLLNLLWIQVIPVNIKNVMFGVISYKYIEDIWVFSVVHQILFFWMKPNAVFFMKIQVLVFISETKFDLKLKKKKNQIFCFFYAVFYNN